MKAKKNGKESAWAMPKICTNCPFAKRGLGAHLRWSLGPERWREITRGLRHGEYFLCHKTTDETGNGTNKVCAGALEYQDNRGITSQYVRICRRLDVIRKLREPV